MIVFDLSRLLSRAGREAPTGIDRVELAYAEHLIASGLPLCFAAMTLSGRMGLLPREAAEAYVAALAAWWRSAAATVVENPRVRRLAGSLYALRALGGESRLHARMRADEEPPVYLLVSHHHLEKPGAIARLKNRTQARFVCLVHDLIPMQYPEYAKPGQDQRHRQRIETTARLADAIIVSSSVTRDDLKPFLQRAGRDPPVLVAPFGVELPPPGTATPLPDRPYFVCIGTIEARKNHLLLLNLWRRLGEEMGDAAPQLVLIGQRGWEAENVVDMLERCPALRGHVIEHNTMPDGDMAPLIKGARAVLLPSFAEGFGFPLVEALALGVPTLCSDIPALRETGGGVPEYLDPLDGRGWREAILDYSPARSLRREEQLRRLSGWRPARWEDHFAAVLQLIAETAARPGS